MRLLPPEVELSGAARFSLSTAATAVAACLVARPAVADEIVRLDYGAPIECPDASVFIERVQQRVPSARMAAPEELAREVVVVVGTDEEGFMARLDFVDVRGETITRTLTGKTCDEVVSGIALVTALALEAQHEPAPEGPSTAPEPAESAPVEPPPEPPAAATPPRVTATEPPKKPRSAPRRARRARPRFRHGAGVGGGSVQYVAPGSPAAFDAVFRLGHTTLAGSVRAGFRSWLSTETIGGRTASFLGYGGALEACPVAWPRSGRVRLEPCAGLTLGVLEGQGDRTNELPVTDEVSIFWADLRAIARLRVALTRLVELEGQGEIGVPLRTHRFLFQSPEQTVFDVPAVGLGWRAGVMLHFP